MTDHLFFYLGLSMIVLHEMDAVRCKEWRIFPGLHLLNDKWGFSLFMFLHIPLFAWIFWELMGHGDPAGFMQGMSVFFLVHLGLHVAFLLHPKNEFKDWISWTIIAGAAACGGLDLLIE